jgi:hypothetical protein
MIKEKHMFVAKIDRKFIFLAREAILHYPQVLGCFTSSKSFEK